MHSKKYKDDDHLVICDSCGSQRYRSECDYTWDGYLMCHVKGCWYEKHPIYEIPPVINDPQSLFDVRPDQTSGTETFVDSQVGLFTKVGQYHALIGHTHKKIGHVDETNFWLP